MYILYLDDAGTVENANETHFILAGQAVFERQAHWLQQGLDKVVKSTGTKHPDMLELHGNEILGARKGSFWRTYKRQTDRRQVIVDALMVATSLQGTNPFFWVVIDKAAITPHDPAEPAFEQICSRFDSFLRRQHVHRNSQRGLIILDRHKKASGETRLRSLAQEFREIGPAWGVIRNLADVPLFADSRATRGLQLADLVAYALWRRFERQDPEFFDTISDAFDKEGGVVHGLMHIRKSSDNCECPYCMTRG